MGIDAEPKFDYKFTYKTPLDQNLVEHEVDHVFTATFDGKPVINTNEVEDWKFVDVNELLVDIGSNPQCYTEWFKLIVQDRYAHG